MNMRQDILKTVRREGNTVILETEHKMHLSILFVTPRTARITAWDASCPPPSYSRAVEHRPSDGAALNLDTENGICRISTEELMLTVTMDPMQIRYYRSGRLLTVTEDLGNGEDGHVYGVHTLFPEEHFYGLGEDNDAYLGNLDRRGHTRDMVTGQRINQGHVTADIPVTFFMSTGSGIPYGLFVDNGWRMTFDMGKSCENSWFWQASGGSIEFYLFAGDTFADLLNEYTLLTGRPSMPPLWTLGYIQCRCSYRNWNEIDEVIRKLDERRFPLDCMVFDYDWAECFHNFKWNSRWNGQSPEKIAGYREKGLHFMASNSGPMLRKDSDNFQSALEAGVLAHDGNGNTVTCGHYGGELMDFTNPAMKEWIRPQLERVMDDGIESWWLDLTEPEGDPDCTQYYAGDKAEVHNSFCLMNVKIYHEITRAYRQELRPFILTRTGTAGIQKYGTAIWSGDVFSDYKTFAAHIPEALNTGMSGIPLWTSDSGGFLSATNNSLFHQNLYQNDLAAHAALYERWLQFSCFCPITRVHHAGQSSPYLFGELMTDGAAHYVRLRYRLLPYIYSCMYKAHRTGTPLMRPLVFENQQDPELYDLKDEYFFGSDLLVAPVTEEKVTWRNVYFPDGVWYDWDDGYVWTGRTHGDVYAPQNRIPLFVRAGAIIPMAPQTFRTCEIDWKHIDLKLWPKGESAFEMYTDSGNGFDFESGDFTITRITCAESEKETRITICRSNSRYAAEEYELEIHGQYWTETVRNGEKNLIRYDCLGSLENADSGFYEDDLRRVLFVKVSVAKDVPELLIQVQHGYPLPPAIGSEEADEAAQMPFLYPPASLPCLLHCENYDRGGEGVAFHIQDPKQRSTLYRSDPVPIELCDDVGVGYDVARLAEGEWLKYTVQVSRAGEYSFQIRLHGTGNVSISVNSQNRTGLISADGSSWTSVSSSPVVLSPGEQVIGLHVHSGCFRVNYIDVREA